jgi:transposase
MAIKKAREREYAKILFVHENLSQKEIAERTDVTEKTICKWAEEDGWKKLKRSLLVTREHNLKQFYEQMEWLNNYIATRDLIFDIPKELLKPLKEVLPDGTKIERQQNYTPQDFPILIGNVATTKEADVLIKLSASIKNLEVETGLGETYEVGRAFIDFVRKHNIALAKEITTYFDLYIQTKTKL